MGGWPVGYLQGLEELNSGPPKTNPSSGREEDLNPGPPDYKSSALPLGHARLLITKRHQVSFKANVFHVLAFNISFMSHSLSLWLTGWMADCPNLPFHYSLLLSVILLSVCLSVCGWQLQGLEVLLPFSTISVNTNHRSYIGLKCIYFLVLDTLNRSKLSDFT